MTQLLQFNGLEVLEHRLSHLHYLENCDQYEIQQPCHVSLKTDYSFTVEHGLNAY